MISVTLLQGEPSEGKVTGTKWFCFLSMNSGSALIGEGGDALGGTQ